MLLLTANIFQPLIDVFESILKFFHGGGISWGWSIVLLTVSMRMIMVPLFIRQFHSMQSLQRLQPEMKALQKKYKEDKQRQQQEMMKFYKENNVNPLGSCLPMVLQLPVFISLYYMLRQSLRDDICHAKQVAYQHHYALVHHITAAAAKGQTTACGAGHHAGFLFISDLTDKATGATLIALIILYVGTQLSSSLLMAQPTMDQTQRRIMLVMPLFFVIFIIQFPAGLLVYWITTNAWTMGQQFVLRRLRGHKVPPVAAAATAGGEAGASGAGGGGGSGGGGGTGPRPRPTAPAPSAGNGSSNGHGGLGGLIRGLGKSEDREVVGQGTSTRTAPPRSPRKKKKRSGRRR